MKKPFLISRSRLLIHEKQNLIWALKCGFAKSFKTNDKLGELLHQSNFSVMGKRAERLAIDTAIHEAVNFVLNTTEKFIKREKKNV